jgi:succinate-semialdehyde dehydrogenase/glutarate-semialdehyde dehydrogenase
MFTLKLRLSLYVKYPQNYLKVLSPQLISRNMSSANSLLNDLQCKAYIDGQWRQSATKTFRVVNPSTGEPIGQSYDCDVRDVSDAIDSAKKAFPEWSQTTGRYRSQLIRKLFELQMRQQREMAEVLTLEMGKPLKESMGEIAYGASFLEWFAEEAKRISGEILSTPWPQKMIMYTKEAIGVVAIITPVRIDAFCTQVIDI